MRISLGIHLLFSLLLFSLLTGHAGAAAFDVRGIGGAGGLFVPSISPYDPNLMFVGSDMGGTYRSADGGASWALIHFSELSDTAWSCFPAFFKDKIYWHSASNLSVSYDKGRTWATLDQPLPWGRTGKIRHLAAMPGVGGESDVLFVSASNGLWRSEDNGVNWRRLISDWTIKPLILGDCVYVFSGRNTFHVSKDRGQTWSQRSFPWFKDNSVFSLTGGSDGEETVLFASLWNLGIVRSVDMGKSWQVVVDKYEDQSNLQMASNQTQVIYAVQNKGKSWCKTVWRSRDGGEDWEESFRMKRWRGNVDLSWVQTELKWGYYITQNGFYASQADPSLALLSTQGELFITRDGAKSWQAIINRPADNSDATVRSYQSTGLEVTSCWKYLIDPFAKNRHFIAYTDIGFARSEDAGKSWRHATKGSPWGNTFYDVVFDLKQPGLLYAAASRRHDIPHWTHIDSGNPKTNRGGVVLSADAGKTWQQLGAGLPDKPATSLLLTPGNDKQPDALYVTLYDEGVFKLALGQKRWRKVSQGLGHPGNMHALRIRQHPASGNLYCLITALRQGKEFPVPGGLWKSEDGGESWRDVTLSNPFLWPTDFTLHPRDEAIIYLSAATAPGNSQGGVWSTADGGKDWRQILTDKEMAQPLGKVAYDHVMTVTLDPDNPAILYAGSALNGLWYSANEGKQWRHYEELPHRAVQSINFNPNNAQEILVTTFGGGVWSGARISAPSVFPASN